MKMKALEFSPSSLSRTFFCSPNEDESWFWFDYISSKLTIDVKRRLDDLIITFLFFFHHHQFQNWVSKTFPTFMIGFFYCFQKYMHRIMDDSSLNYGCQKVKKKLFRQECSLPRLLEKIRYTNTNWSWQWKLPLCQKITFLLIDARASNRSFTSLLVHGKLFIFLFSRPSAQNSFWV